MPVAYQSNPVFRAQTTSTPSGKTVGELWIYGVIDEWDENSAKDITKAILSFGDVDEILVHANSPGGYIHEGMAIYRTLVNHSAKVVMEIDFLAASMMSAIAMAGDEIRIAESGWFMVHAPSSGVTGTADDMVKVAEYLESLYDSILDVYAARTSIDKDKLREMCDEETWINSHDAIELGFADSIMPNKTKPDAKVVSLMATANLNNFRNAPPEVVAMFSQKKRKVQNTMPTTTADKPQEPIACTIAEVKSLCKGVDDAFVLAQVEAGHTKAEVLQNYADFLQAKQDSIEEEKKKAATAKNTATGVDGLSVGKPSSPGRQDGNVATAEAQWNDAVSEEMKTKNVTRPIACRRIATMFPRLHSEFVADRNKRVKEMQEAKQR